MWVLFQRVCGFCAVKGDISFLCDLSIQADSLKKKSPIFMKTKAKKNTLYCTWNKHTTYIYCLKKDSEARKNVLPTEFLIKKNIKSSLISIH